MIQSRRDGYVKTVESSVRAYAAPSRIGGWNDMRVLVEGPRVRTWVNGVAAVDYVDPEPKYTDGVIALQLHAGGEGRMRFKDIRIREIR